MENAWESQIERMGLEGQSGAGDTGVSESDMGGEPGEGGTGRQGKATLALRISMAPMSLPLPWTGTVDTVSTSAPSAEHRLLVKMWELMLVCLTQHPTKARGGCAQASSTLHPTR